MDPISFSNYCYRILLKEIIDTLKNDYGKSIKITWPYSTTYYVDFTQAIIETSVTTNRILRIYVKFDKEQMTINQIGKRGKSTILNVADAEVLPKAIDTIKNILNWRLNET